MHSSSSLYSWGNPVPPSGPCEVTRLWRNFVGFSPGWTDPVPPFNPPGAVNLSSSSHLSGLLLPFSQACLVPATRIKAHESRDHLRLPFVSLSDPSAVTYSNHHDGFPPPKCIGTTRLLFPDQGRGAGPAVNCTTTQLFHFVAILDARRRRRFSCHWNGCHLLNRPKDK